MCKIEGCKWVVQGTVNNKTIYISRYNNLEDAIAARQEASKKYYKEYANDIWHI